MKAVSVAVGQRSLRPGDLVEVRPAGEIIATLDENGEANGMPFMPEMLPYVGRRCTVAQLALKICYPPGNVHLPPGVVFLDDLRCDGSAHGNCHAECRIYWRSEWLRLVGPDDPPVEPSIDADLERLAGIAEAHVVPAGATRGERGPWSCQVTQVKYTGKPVPWTEPSQYVRELTSGNVGFVRFSRVMAGAVLRPLGRKLRLVDRLPSAGADRVDGESLGLGPGEWAEVRSVEEIGRTLDANGRHRGLTFTDEMAQHCGKRFRVRRRVERIIDEISGNTIELSKNACISLEGLICTGDRANRVWFCHKDQYPYWREAWLKRIDPPEASQ
jgi:hypothetical protein